MARKPQPPVIDPKDGLRQRLRADGTWRVWWEPTAMQRKAGAKSIEFDARQPGHAMREAARLVEHWNRVVKGEVKPRPTARTVSSLVKDYKASRRYQRLRDTTKASYDTDIRAIEAKWGPHPVVLFDKPTCDVWYETLLGKLGRGRARAILGMLRILMAHAEKRGWREAGTNPVQGLDMEAAPVRQRVGTWPELTALVEATQGHVMVRLGLLLAMHTGQRQTDILQARPEEFGKVPIQLRPDQDPIEIWVWSFTRSKRGNDGVVPLIDPDLVAALEAAQAMAEKGPGTLIWNVNNGLPFTKERWFDRWEEVRERAAEAVPSVASLQWRDLRRTFSTLTRAGGASVDDVGDVIGNTAAKNALIRGIYMVPQIETGLRAVSAMQPPSKRKAGGAA